MSKLKGVCKAKKKDGSIYYRASITYKNKHISLGSFSSENLAHKAYLEANRILTNNITYKDYNPVNILHHDKWIVLHNFRDSGVYIKNPIYLHTFYFSYYLDEKTELKFDADDLFYYSNHKIFKRDGYLFVNDYGMQVNILSRYGIKNFACVNRDYYFKDGDSTNFRYHNVVIINKYYGVEKRSKNNKIFYRVKIHIHGNFKVGDYKDEIHAAIAYNKAADFLNMYGISKKNFQRNYINDYSAHEYKQIYDDIELPKKILTLKHSNKM